MVRYPLFPCNTTRPRRRQGPERHASRRTEPVVCRQRRLLRCRLHNNVGRVERRAERAARGSPDRKRLQMSTVAAEQCPLRGTCFHSMCLQRPVFAARLGRSLGRGALGLTLLYSCSLSGRVAWPEAASLNTHRRWRAGVNRAPPSTVIPRMMSCLHPARDPVSTPGRNHHVRG